MPKNEKLMNEIIKQSEVLTPMPAVAKRALWIMNDPAFNMKELGEILATDQAIASTLLRWANSPYFGLVSPVATVPQAVAYLGENTVRNLVLTGALATYMDRPIPGYFLDRGELWKHSVGVAIAARMITEKFGKQLSEQAYTAGLLCDIGKLAFENMLRGIRIGAEWNGKSFEEIEEYYFGINHADLGAELIHRWGLPAALQEAIAFHHHPSAANTDTILPSAVHLGDSLIMMLGIGIGRDGLQYSVDPIVLERLRIGNTEMQSLLERLIPKMSEANNLIGEG